MGYDGTVTHAACGGELPYQLVSDNDGVAPWTRTFTTIEFVAPPALSPPIALTDDADPYCRCEDITEAEYATMIAKIEGER